MKSGITVRKSGGSYTERISIGYERQRGEVMAIRLTDIWPPENGKYRALVMQEGGIATFGERTIVQTPVARNGKDHDECWIWSTEIKNHNTDLILAIVRMRAGMDLKIEKSEDGVRGVKFFDADNSFLEFVPFTDDGEGLDWNGKYKHVEIEPAYNDREAQLVTVS